MLQIAIICMLSFVVFENLVNTVLYFNKDGGKQWQPEFSLSNGVALL